MPENGYCTYSLPSSIAGGKTIALYQGVVGSSTLIGADLYSGAATLIEENPVAFYGAKDGDDFFAVVYDPSLDQNTTHFYDYLMGRSAAPPPGAVQNQNYFIIPWKWGPVPTSEFEPVVLVPGILGSWQKDGQWVLDPISHTYDNLLDTFRANGYVDGKTLFPFPYDWEQSNEATAHLLAQKIQDIKTSCSCNKVNIVAHSMGGLVAEQYIESSEYKNDVDQLIMLAVPQAGSPFAYQAWEGGDIEFKDPIENAFLQTKFESEALENKYLGVFDYIRGKPIVSIQELLPVYDNYLKVGKNTLQYPNGYPENLFLETLINNFPENSSGVRINVVEANDRKNDTPVSFTVASSTDINRWKDGKPVATTFGVGDGTVPETSTLFVAGPDKLFVGATHNTVVSTSSAYVFQVLNNRQPDKIIHTQYNLITSFLKFELLSPIDMQITAPDGKRLGKNFTNNTELDEISNAFYSGFDTDNEYAIIPNPEPGTYKVQTIGTGNGGHYTVVADYADMSTTTESQLQGTTTSGEIISNTLILSATSSVTFTQDIVALTPDSCIADLAKAYTNKWINKKQVYDKVVADCKTLKDLFKTRDNLKKISTNIIFLKPIFDNIKARLDDMDAQARDNSNTKEAVLLIAKYTSWFREHALQ